MIDTAVHPVAEADWAEAVGPEVPEDEVPASLTEALEARLQLWPDGELVTCDAAGRSHAASYRRLMERSLAIASGLDQGVAGRIAILAAGDALAFTAGYWACLRSGAIILPLTRRFAPGRVQEPLEILARLEQPLVLVDEATSPPVREAAARLGLEVMSLAELETRGAGRAPGEPVRRPPDMPACLLATSGSTGQVKLAVMPEAVLIRRRFVRSQPFPGPDSTDLVLFDLDTVTGMNVVFPVAQRQVQIAPALAVGRPLAVVETLERYGLARTMLTCSLAGLIAEALERSRRAWDLSKLKVVALGGERVDPFVASRLADALRAHGAREVEMRAGYGATETGTLVTGASIPRADSAAEASGPLCLGAAVAGASLRIVGEDGRLLRKGQVGLIEARATGLTFGGYWGDEAASQAAFTDDGWWRSGDLGALEADGLWMHGRAKDVIVARGKKLALGDIDARLQAVAVEFDPGGACRVLSCAIQTPGEASEQLALAVFSQTVPPAGQRELLGRALRRTAAMEFGLNPSSVAHRPMTELPLGAGGKVVRRALAELAASTVPEPRGSAPQGLQQGGLAELWREVLGFDGPLDPASDFFELGGDSLASEQLFAGLESRFGRSISPEAFFDAPTLGALQALLDAGAPEAPRAPAADEGPWPLPEELRQRLLTRIETWPGERPTAGRLMAGLNLEGTRPPLFWVFQGGEEFAALAGALGPDQPLHGFRSGYLVFRYTEDQIQMAALRFVQDILEACPEGPLLVGGNCQGGVIALAVAQHLARRRRTPSLLVLMEWGFELQPYHGEVLFLHGEDSLQGSPYLRHRRPDEAWRRLLSSWQVETIPGAHGGYFMGGNVLDLAETLSRHASRTVSAPLVLQLAAEAVELKLANPPARLSPGQALSLLVEVRNVGRWSWAGAVDCALMAGDYWLGPGGQVERWLDARTPVPPLEPGEATTLQLDIVAPSRPGAFTLVVDLVEEGSRWLDPGRSRAPQVQILVEAD